MIHGREKTYLFQGLDICCAFNIEFWCLWCFSIKAINTLSWVHLKLLRVLNINGITQCTVLCTPHSTCVKLCSFHGCNCSGLGYWSWGSQSWHLPHSLMRCLYSCWTGCPCRWGLVGAHERSKWTWATWENLKILVLREKLYYNAICTEQLVIALKF